MRQEKAEAQIPVGIGTQTVITPSQGKPLIKMISRMLPKMRVRGKKTTTSADVKIGHKKLKYW